MVESVTASLAGHRSSLNHRLHADIEALANYINTAKAEIAAIKPDKISSEYLPEASDQLSAIVGATEQATHDIFEAVESIEELTAKMEPVIAAAVTDATTRVYEACGFQDITGQRISKVVKALENVEAKVQALLAAIGEADGVNGREGTFQAAVAEAAPEHTDEALMNGPQLPDDAISQDDVDVILASFD